MHKEKDYWLCKLCFYFCHNLTKNKKRGKSMPHGEEFIALRENREELTGEEFNGEKIIGNHFLHTL